MSIITKISRLDTNTNFMWLVLTYSLLPGLSKIMGIQVLMMINILIIGYLFYKGKNNIRIYRVDFFLLFFLVYILIQSFFFFFFPFVNRTGLMMGFYLSIIPILGYFISRSIAIEQYAQSLLKIVFIHCIIGIVLYPAFGFTNRSMPIVDVLLDGVAFGRMSSVSGSLPFGNLMMTGFTLSLFFNKKLLPIIIFCLLFSAQRSAWIGSFFIVIVYLWMQFKQTKVLNIFSFVLVTMLFLLLGHIVIGRIFNIDLGFIYTRIERLGDASGERVDLWRNGIYNFIENPMGVGVGQVGQVASRFENAYTVFRLVPDGDYFRVLSEHGLIGGVFYIFSVFLLCFMLFFLRFGEKSEAVIVALLLGNFFQMIGSNISEFYFSNFLYWMTFGYFFHLVHNKVKLYQTIKVITPEELR